MIVCQYTLTAFQLLKLKRLKRKRTKLDLIAVPIYLYCKVEFLLIKCDLNPTEQDEKTTLSYISRYNIAISIDESKRKSNKLVFLH